MTLSDALMAVATPLRRLAGWLAAMPWLVAAIAGLTVAAWLGRWGIGARAGWASVAWLLLGVAVVVAVIRAATARRRMSPVAIAGRLERGGAWRRGALTTLLTPVAPGSSQALHAAAHQEQVERVRRAGADALAEEVGVGRRRLRRQTVALVGVALGLIAARPVTGGALMSPWQAWRALVAPLRLTTTTPIVERGESAVFQVTALGQSRATLLTRSPGEEWQQQQVTLDAAGHATVTTPPLAGDLIARLEAAGRRSADVAVTVRLPAFLGELSVRADYPDYLDLAAEDLSVGDTLIVPLGTRLAVSGQATVALARGHLATTGDTVALTIDGSNFSATMTPRRDATWMLNLVTAQQGSVDGVPVALPVRVIADSAPTVAIPVPGVDTVAPPSRRLPLVVAITDDHGISQAALEMRRGAAAPIVQQLDLAGVADRALLSVTLELAATGAAPGDTVSYRVVARDNAPVSGIGSSREFRIVIPTAADERRSQREATQTAATTLDSLAEAARSAQRTTEDLARQRQRGADGAEAGDAMSAEAARRAEQAADAQEAMSAQIDSVRRQIDSLSRARAEAAPEDSSLAADMAEIRSLLDQAMSPELQQAMERLRESLQQLDAEGTRAALSDLAAQQQKMRDAIARARDLFSRAALETLLADLATEADELAEAQQRAREQLASDAAAGAQAESALADRSDSLAQQLDAAAEQSEIEQTADGLRQAAAAAQRASAAMRQAAAAASEGETSAADQAEQASEALEPLGDQIRQQRETMQQQMRADVLAELQRLLNETTRVLARQQAVATAFQRGALVGALRTEEAMLEEATSKLLQQVITVAGKNALISPRASVALAGARDAVRGTLEAASAATPTLALAADRATEAVDLLSLAAYSLLQSSRNVEGSQSGSGLSEAMEQMMQAAGQQNAAAEKGQAMQQQGAMPGAGELLQLAMQQRAVAQQLDRLRAEGQLPGAGELARETHQVARQIEAGQLTAETVQRQQTLFRRMLDAGRSLEGDQDKESSERQSEEAGALPAARPAALDPRVLRGAEFPVPGWDELQRLSAADRRRVLDYFRRLAEAPR